MKSSIFYSVGSLFAILVILSFNSCAERVEARSALNKKEKPPGLENNVNPKKPLSSEFKSYWYSGTAEITSYKLEQARYGELREGHAVLVYVTEPFLAGKQVKADRNNPDNISVLKLNSTKKYLTGIYPYSIMSSTFYPVFDNQHAVKVSTSVQEWCGQVYSQLNNREEFEIDSHSYFEGEADQQINLPKTWLENEIWNKIRVNPAGLPLGEIEMIPSLEFIRTAHKEIQAYNAIASMTESGGVKTYTLEFKQLNRILSIDFTANFPYIVEGWRDTFQSGYGSSANVLTSSAARIKTLQTPYWEKNGIKDEVLRKELGL